MGGSLQGILFNKGDSLYRADFIFVLVLDSFFFPHINKLMSRNNFFVRACVMSLWFRKRVHPRESCSAGQRGGPGSPEDILRKSARGVAQLCQAGAGEDHPYQGAA